MLTVDTKIIVAVNDVKSNIWLSKKDRQEYIGHTGIVFEVDTRSNGYQYVVKFDDYDLEKKNQYDGVWLWSEKELIPLEEDNTDYVR